MSNTNTNILEQRGILFKQEKFTNAERTILYAMSEVAKLHDGLVNKDLLTKILYDDVYYHTRLSMRQLIYKIIVKIENDKDMFGKVHIAHCDEKGQVGARGKFFKFTHEERFW